MSTPNAPSSSPAPRDAPLPGAVEMLLVLVRWRPIVLGFTIGMTVMALIVSLLLPPTYRARASLLPLQDNPGLTSLTSLMSAQADKIFSGLGGSSSSADLLMSILESREMQERIVDRLQLVERLSIRAKTPERARNVAIARLQKMTRLGMSKRSSIFVDASAPTPALAAEVANEYLGQLDLMNQEFALASARQTRRFLESRLAESGDSLAASQTRLTLFQRRHGMVLLDQQAKAAVDVAARLQGELMGLEAQLEVQKRYSTGAFSRTRELEYRITALRNRMRLLTGSSGDVSADSGFVMTFGQMPALAREFADLTMRVKTHEAVFTLLTAQYEQTRIEESRDIPTVQVLDRAAPPLDKDTPRRRQNVVAGFAMGLGGGVLLAFLLEALLRLLAGPAGARLRAVDGRGRVAAFEAWLTRVRRDA